MALSKKGLTSGAIKGLTVRCFIVCFVWPCYEPYKAICRSYCFIQVSPHQ
ncbi:unnamed protein product [Staurois parvus]|uniref:Uncharacterized protein n=1 Tax=Staurois parvus TaxID=386267 RepID=A0ABN9BJE0_9NEOB|nr:unnamed protein product [Staurois parvus]